MASGVECRLPSLDRRVVERAFNFPCRSHLDPAGGGGALPPLAARELLPAAAVERPERQLSRPETTAVECARRGLVARHRPEVRAAEVDHRVCRAGLLRGAEPLPLTELAPAAVLPWRWETKVALACAR